MIKQLFFSVVFFALLVYSHYVVVALIRTFSHKDIMHFEQIYPYNSLPFYFYPSPLFAHFSNLDCFILTFFKNTLILFMDLCRF